MNRFEELIARYENGGELLRYASQGLSPEQAQSRPGPGAWSIAELVVHMLDSDLVASDRMRRVMAEENPTLLAYDENAWIQRLQADRQPIDEAAALFASQRRWTARLLRQCDDADFSRAGNHTERGRMTLADLLSGYIGHLDHHLKFLYAKRANLGVSLYPRYSKD